MFADTSIAQRTIDDNQVICIDIPRDACHIDATVAALFECGSLFWRTFERSLVIGHWWCMPYASDCRQPLKVDELVWQGGSAEDVLLYMKS